MFTNFIATSMETLSSTSTYTLVRPFTVSQNSFERTASLRHSNHNNSTSATNFSSINRMGFNLLDEVNNLPDPIPVPIPVRTPMSTVSNQNHQVQVVENVKVKTSAHVSYIVGKQGKKIRELRQRTGTYISTPVNGDDPIFVIKGPLNGVNIAKDEIQKESNQFDHEIYTQAFMATNGKQDCINFFLPSHLIGLVVGKKGATIKRIMEQSNTTIETPKVNTINRFRILGTKSAIEQAVSLIKSTITDLMRCSISEEHGPYSITFHVKNPSAY